MKIVAAVTMSNVFMYVLLAAIGWTGMLFVGMGYRLLPAMLSVAVPADWTVYLSALFLIAALFDAVKTASLIRRTRAEARC
jgi:hypothetical protein